MVQTISTDKKVDGATFALLSFVQTFVQAIVFF